MKITVFAAGSRGDHHTLQLTLGGIGKKPGVVAQRVEVREYLSVTISFDHDIIDGAPAARFIQRLKELVENGHGLDDHINLIQLRQEKSI